ncbi:hypothetical protein BD324DRAFT_618365 [Kockovaella imperatae]|uniref:MARVEL domain-containing protein n=1 Tax=Kockovaella imperatae TaxID=4999 RepID=A0A1Y1UPJ4_9TREE|nr:hypothetical protein BD324DRAFT_618365 [Kockovaella imperatae]ORX39055.1 hypothetical protein BD324DRAFT_618365 [Kockovaella imperatae]
MDRLRSLRAKMPSSPSMATLPGGKLTKAFKFNKEAKVLPNSQSRWGANPFNEGPNLEEPSLPRFHLVLHCAAIFFTFLAICMTGAVANFQATWFAVSGGTAFTLFLLLVAILLSVALFIVPTVYDRWDKLKSANGFLSAPRTRLIIHAFGALLMLIAAFIVTVSAWTSKGCKNPEDDPHHDLGDEYTTNLGQWCQTKKASGIFEWLSFISWLVLLILTLVEWRRERRDEPRFVPPESGISNVNVHERLARRRDDEEATIVEDPYAEKEVDDPKTALRSGYESYGYSRTAPEDDLESEAFGRPSMDTHVGNSTLNGTTLGGGGSMSRIGESGEASRTMQIAYHDPCECSIADLKSQAHAAGVDAHIRQSLLGGSSNPYAPVDAQQTPVQAHTYQTVPVQQVQQVPQIQQVQPVQAVQQVHQTYPAQLLSPTQYGRGVLPQPPTYQTGYGGYQ